MHNSGSVSNQTLLGFDFGLKRIGVAVGQTVTRTATPLNTLQAEMGVPRWEEIAQLIKTWQPQALVVGIPLHLDDTQQPITTAARNFAAQLKEHFGLPVHNMDERLTTKEAKQQLFDSGGFRKLQKSQIDSYAAKLILESWLQQFSQS